MNGIIPSPDALPLPGPVWLFKSLLHLTFFLHLLAMNFLLGGAVIALVNRLRGGDEGHALARWIEGKLPTTMALTVTLGVAPLLFVQVVYGQLLYTSSVLMAWPWWFVVPVLIVAYYSAYTLSFRGERYAGALRGLSWVLMLGLLYVSHIYVHNMSLAIRPEAWAAIYHGDPSGMNLNYGDPSFWPRWLHFLLAAIAVAGLAIGWVGARRVGREDASGHVMLRQGNMWFLIITALQYLIGTWFLLSLPRETILFFMGGSVGASIALFASLTLPLGALMTAALAVRHPQPSKLMNVSVVHLLATVLAMIFVRDYVRDHLLRGVFETSSLVVEAQWGVLGIFLALLVLGLGTVGWMLKRFWATS